MALERTQQQTVDRWFPGAEVVADMSWGLVDTVVLHLKTQVGEVVVKAAGPGNRHIGREISGHRDWAGPWLAGGHVNRLLHADPERSLLALSYLPGTLVQGTPAAADPGTYRQAGELLAAFHGQASTVSEDYEARMDTPRRSAGSTGSIGSVPRPRVACGASSPLTITRPLCSCQHMATGSRATGWWTTRVASAS